MTEHRRWTVGAAAPRKAVWFGKDINVQCVDADLAEQLVEDQNALFDAYEAQRRRVAELEASLDDLRTKLAMAETEMERQRDRANDAEKSNAELRTKNHEIAESLVKHQVKARIIRPKMQFECMVDELAEEIVTPISDEELQHLMDYLSTRAVVELPEGDSPDLATAETLEQLAEIAADAWGTNIRVQSENTNMRWRYAVTAILRTARSFIETDPGKIRSVLASGAADRWQAVIDHCNSRIRYRVELPPDDSQDLATAAYMFGREELKADAALGAAVRKLVEGQK